MSLLLLTSTALGKDIKRNACGGQTENHVHNPSFTRPQQKKGKGQHRKRTKY